MSARSVAARRYAKALYELADEAKLVEKVQRDLADFAGALRTSAELRAFLENPAFPPDVKKRVVAAIAERMGCASMVVSTLRLLVDRRRIAAVGDLADAFAAIAERRSGRIRAEVVTAVPLNDAYYAEIEKALAEATGRSVTVVRRIDPSILGGVVARVGDTVLDGSIAHRLMDIRAQLLEKAAPFAR